MDLFDLIGLGFKVTLYALIVGAAWRAYRDLKMNRIVRSALLVLSCIGMVGCGAWFRMVPGSRYLHEAIYCGNLFGEWFILPKPRLTYDSPREFNGDGYSIDVIEMSDGFWAWFDKHEEQLMKSHPIKPSLREKWKQVLWHRSPITDTEKPFLDFATAGFDGPNQLVEARALLIKLASSKGSLIAYCHQSFSNGISDIDFCLLNPSEKVFIRVNNNT